MNFLNFPQGFRIFVFIVGLAMSHSALPQISDSHGKPYEDNIGSQENLAIGDSFRDSKDDLEFRTYNSFGVQDHDDQQLIFRMYVECLKNYYEKSDFGKDDDVGESIGAATIACGGDIKQTLQINIMDFEAENISKIARSMTGISVKDINKQGVLGGENSVFRKVIQDMKITIPSKMHYVWPYSEFTKVLPSGYGFYTYLLAGNVSRRNCVALVQECERLASVLSALQRLPNSHDEQFHSLIDSGFPKSRINLFAVPLRKDYATEESISLGNYDFKSSIIMYSAMLRLIERSGNDELSTQLRSSSGPFFMILSNRLEDMDFEDGGLENALIADLQNMHPNAAMELVKRLQQDIDKNSIDGVVEFDPASLRILNTLLSVDDALTLIRPAMGDWLKFSKEIFTEVEDEK